MKIDIKPNDCSFFTVSYSKGLNTHVMLPLKLVPKIKEQMVIVKKIHQNDLEDGRRKVSMPKKISNRSKSAKMAMVVPTGKQIKKRS